MRGHRRDQLRRRRAHALLAGLILVAALGIRIAYVSALPYHAINDAGTYNRMASTISRFGDYRTGTKPGTGAGGSRGPTAYFPPAFPYYLAIADLIDGHQTGGKTAVPGERVEMAVTGTISVALVGLVALEAFGEGVALAAMALAALYPVMIALSGTLVAEDLVVPLELAAVWSLLRARRARGRRVWAWVAAAGVLTGLTALTHENALVYVIPFGFAAWAIARRGGARSKLRALAAPALLIATTAVMIAPWTIRNAVELHAFVPISDETGITLIGTYNPVSANDPRLPYKWALFSRIPLPVATVRHRYTEPALSSVLQRQAFHYIGAHPLAPLQATADNTLRMFELEGTYAWHASASAMGLKTWVAGVGVVSFWIVCGLALLGIPTRRARRAPWWLWTLPVLWWITVAPINMETPRFREPLDPFLILLAACAVATAAAWLSGLRGAPVRRRGGAPELAPDQAQLVQMVQRLA